MASRNNTLKAVLVRERGVQAVPEAGIFELNLPDGTKIVALGNTMFPNYDKGALKLIMQYLEEKRPEVVILLGHMVDEDAFVALDGKNKNFLHKLKDSPEFAQAAAKIGFEHKVLELGRLSGEFIKQFTQFGATVFYIPAWSNFGLSSELGVMEFIHRKKDFLDSWAEDHPKATVLSSDPSISLPTEIDQLFGIAELDNIQTLPFGAAIKVNDRTLFLDGSFRRRQPGDASLEEWAQRGYSIVISPDGKSASAWWTDTQETFPHVKYNHYQAHELGYLWDRKRMGHGGDYHRRAQSFGSWTIFSDILFGQTIPFIPGDDGRRSIFVDGKGYTEETPGGLMNGGILQLASSDSPKPPTASRTRKGRGS